MKVPTFIAASFITAIFALQAWTLHEVIDLKVQFATMQARQNFEVATNTKPK